MSMALHSIAVVGGGPVALTAATALARALPRARVILVPAPVPNDALADRWPATSPATAPLFVRFGPDPHALLAAGAATLRLATRFTDWSRNGQPWLVGDGRMPPATAGAAWHHLWLRAGDSGIDFHALFPAAAMALAGRTLPTDDDPASPLTTIEPALRLDASRAFPLLAQAARTAGVGIAPHPFGRIEPIDGRIAALYLADGTRIEADLYVDATGPAALLAGRLDTSFIDWSSALPCDRLLVSATVPTPSPIDEYRAIDTGWTARWPDARLLAHAAATGDRQARRIFGVGGDAAAAIALTPGRRTHNWTGNCLALGDAAVQPGALGRTGFALALDHLALALDLLPDRTMEPLLIAEYNRRAAQRADRLRDFLSAHYLLGSRRRGAFWQGLRDREHPAGLAMTLARFEQRGYLPHAEEDIDRDAWLAVLIGQGLRPRHTDPVAAGIPVTVATASVRRLAADLASHAARLPASREYAA